MLAQHESTCAQLVSEVKEGTLIEVKECTTKEARKGRQAC